MEGGSDSVATPFIPTEYDAFSTAPQVVDTHSPIRKGAQHQDTRSNRSLSAMPDAPQPPSGISQDLDIPCRDPEYYMVDGSCVLLVGNTLFNVHRSIVSADSSSFSDLFSLPQGDIVEGKSDDNPIVLHGDTPEEFRNFLWSLYALPQEIMTAARGSDRNIDRFIDIAKLASKYSFKSVETWALEVIQEYVERRPSPLLDTIPLGFHCTINSPSSTFLESKHQISRLVQLAQMCGHTHLLDTTITLLRQLMSLSPHFSYLAISLADELNLRELRGAAYLEVLQRSVFISGREANGNVLVEGDVHENSDGVDRLVVSRLQQVRLLSGYHRLSKAWEKLRAVPIPFEHTASCGTSWNQQSCTHSWSEFWKEKTRTDAVLALGTANVIGKLRVISKEFDKWGSATYMHSECKSAARQAIQDTIKHIGDSLPDFFHEDGEH
ncbi:hypothetical protein JVU11DRAFT_3522 [Chiua virens]|nr:hypothetical protein JVU11DRAFT_3522 [Chiua virens]